MNISSIYLKDWYNRSNSDYVLTNKDLEIGFVKTPTKQYSRFLYNEDKAERICNDRRLIIKEMRDLLKSMGLFNVSFTLSSDVETACTNGSSIEVGYGEKTNNINDVYNKLDRIIGMTIHESCHCLYTDFTHINSVISKYPSLVHHIHNVLEDELIEEKICDRYPGYSNFLSKLKYQIFENHADKVNESPNELSLILSIFFIIIRYPKYLCTIDKSILHKYEDLFKNIKNIVNNTGCLNIKNEYPTKSTTNAAIQIYDLLKEYINEESEENGNFNMNNSSSSSNSDSNESDDIDVEVRDKDDDIFKNNEKELTEGNGSGIVAILNDVYNQVNSISEATSIKKLITYHDKISTQTENEILEDHDITGDNLNIKSLVNACNYTDSKNYNVYLNSVNNYITYAKKLIIPNSYSYDIVTDRFRRNGTLDSTRLVNAMCNEQNVYTQKRTVIKNNDPKYALVLAIDESGSMDCDKLNVLASEFSIMIYEALKNYPNIKLFVYGHGDCVYRYIDPFTLKSKYTLGNRNRQCGQNEALSYKIIVDDVKSFTNLPIVVFNITDSCYIANAESIKTTLENLRNDTIQPTYFNLITLGHNNHLNEKITSWNNDLYGEGNWVIYNRSKITFEIKSLIDVFSKIIKKNFK